MKTTVQLGGKTYDAITGSLIDDVRPVRKATPQNHNHVAVPTPKPAVRAPLAKTEDAAQAAPVVSAAAPKPVRQVAAHAPHRIPQQSKTLMRHAVKKPTPGLKKTLHVQSPLAKQAEHAVVQKVAVQAVDTNRLQRAEHTEKHANVHRYGAPVVSAEVAHVPVQAAPEEPNQGEVAAPAPKPSNGPDELFERAVQNANHFVDITARRVHFKKKARLHVASMTAGTLAILLIAGFAAYQNMPGVQLKIAGYRAGVATANPNFKSSGFAYNGVSVRDGKRVIGLKNSHGQYQLIQQSTNWSGSDMIQQVSSVSASGATNYTTIPLVNNTAYRLSNTQATWVSRGVWYQVTGNAALTDAQIRAIAQNS